MSKLSHWMRKSPQPRPRQQERAWIEDISKRSVDILRKAEIKVSCEVREGDPKQELCKAAEEWRADCIFFGSAGFSNRLERFVVGSISAAVAARAHCSVEVVRVSGAERSLWK